MSQSIRISGSGYTPRRGVHWHDHYEILIICGGTGSHSVDGTEFHISSNQLYFLRPGQLHEFRPNADAQFHFIAFDRYDTLLGSGMYLNQFEFFQSFYIDAPIELETIEPLVGYLGLIRDELNGGLPMMDLVVSNLVTVFLVYVQRQFIGRGGGHMMSDLVVRFNQLIDDIACRFRFVREYADALHVSPTYLNDLVRQETGYSSSYWIQRKHTKLAKYLLSDVSKPLKVVARDLGYRDPNHFSRFFKQHTEMTPTEYRACVIAGTDVTHGAT